MYLFNQMQFGIISYGLFWQMNKSLSFFRWRCMHSRPRQTPNWASAKATDLRWQEFYSLNTLMSGPSLFRLNNSWLNSFKQIITILIILIVVITITFITFAGPWQTSIWPWMVQGKKPDGPGLIHLMLSPKEQLRNPHFPGGFGAVELPARALPVSDPGRRWQKWLRGTGNNTCPSIHLSLWRQKV